MLSSFTEKPVHHLGSRKRSSSKENRSSHVRSNSQSKFHSGGSDAIAEKQTVRSHFYPTQFRNTFTSEGNSVAEHGWYPPKDASLSSQVSRMRLKEVTNHSQETSRVKLVRPGLQVSNQNSRHAGKSRDNSPILRVSPKMQGVERFQATTFRPSTTAVVYPIQTANEREAELVRKLKVVEERVAQLQAEKQSIQSVLTEENRRLFHENSQLKKKVQDAQIEETRLQVGELEGMLEQEITKSLELMEESEGLKEKLCHQALELEEAKSQLLRGERGWTSKEAHWQSQLQSACSQLEHALTTRREMASIYERELCHLKDRVNHLESQITLKGSEYESELAECCRRSRELEETHATQTAQKLGEIDELKRTIYGHELKLQTMEEELERRGRNGWLANSGLALNSSGLSMEQSGLMPNESSKVSRFESESGEGKKCSKCQQLLKTVFKLNSHLNNGSKK